MLAAQAAVTKQSSDSDVIRENYTQHHSTLSTPQSGSYFDQTSGSAVASQLSAALGWQGRGQADFSSLRSQSDLSSNNQLPSAFGILPHENVPSSPGPTTTAKTSSSVYESFNAHFPQVCFPYLQHLNSSKANKSKSFIYSIFGKTGREKVKTTKLSTHHSIETLYVLFFLCFIIMICIWFLIGMCVFFPFLCFFFRFDFIEFHRHQSHQFIALKSSKCHN